MSNLCVQFRCEYEVWITADPLEKGRGGSMLTGLPWQQTGHSALSALLFLIMNPLLYIGFALTLWDYSRNGKYEKKFFGVRVTKSTGTVAALWCQSLVIGVLLTLVYAIAGVVVTTQEMWLVTGLCILFALVRVRFISPIYSISVWIVLALVTHVMPPVARGATMNHWWHVVHDFHTVSWLAIAATLCIAEGMTLWLNRHHPGFPAAVLSKRGRSIGAFVVKLPFIVPVGLVMDSGSIPTTSLPHAWPWLVHGLTSVSFTAMPFLIGHAGIFTTTTPKNGLRRLWPIHLYTGVIVAGVVYVSYQFGVQYALLGAVLAVVSKELALWRGQHLENRLDPIFTPVQEGVRVLSVVHGSLAHSMKLLPGEVITHVNQVPVHTPYDLHFAFDQNPAYAKLRVMDTRGESRFVGNPVYTGERNKLGLILAPDSYDGPCYNPLKSGLFQTCYLKLASHGRNPEEAWIETTSAPSHHG